MTSAHSIRLAALRAVATHPKDQHGAIAACGWPPNQVNVAVSVLKTEKLIHKTPSGWLLTAAGRRQLEEAKKSGS